MQARARTKIIASAGRLRTQVLTSCPGTFHRMDVGFHRSGRLNFQRWFVQLFKGLDTVFSTDLVWFSQVWIRVFQRIWVWFFQRIGLVFTGRIFWFFQRVWSWSFRGLDTVFSMDLVLDFQGIWSFNFSQVWIRFFNGSGPGLSGIG